MISISAMLFKGGKAVLFCVKKHNVTKMQSSNTKLINLGRSGLEDQNVKGAYINRMSSPDSSVALVIIKTVFFFICV